MLINIIIALSGAAFGAAIALFLYTQRLNKAKSSANAILTDAKREADDIIKEATLEAKEKAMNIKNQAEKEAKEKTKEVTQFEKKLLKREYYLEQKSEVAEKKEEQLQNRAKELDKEYEKVDQERQEIQEIKQQQLKKLEKVAHMTQSEAKSKLMADMVNKAKKEAAGQVRKIKDKAINEAKRQARKIIVSAIQRSAADHTAETTVSVINLPNDNMKGRIIGREGRNIRHFEKLTGVEVIVDDTPEAVVLSGFDPIRREVARIALEKLIEDGRIHPARIEEMYEKAKEEVDDSIIEAAEDAIDEVSISPLPRELMKTLGRLKYRTSYGQNVLNHSIEVAWLAGLMASELELNGNLAKRAGLLHDIGKAIDRNITGTHASIGADIAKRFNEEEVIINSIASHHEEVEPDNLISILIQAADQISGSRRGARGDTLENYIKRLEKLEGIAESFDGVAKSYAIQAGREVRVMVENDKVNDNEASMIADDIANKIEQEANFPGQIKVMVLREHRSISYAKS
ncbi:MAG: ribonuclease Y [Candidatus Marinimicrobia bacterium]|nr:ribonuclease Y [Candidatus Neomarinimicrobiota bacterium]